MEAFSAGGHIHRTLAQEQKLQVGSFWLREGVQPQHGCGHQLLEPGPLPCLSSISHPQPPEHMES